MSETPTLPTIADDPLMRSHNAQERYLAGVSSGLLAAQLRNPVPLAQQDIARWAAALGLPAPQADALNLLPRHAEDTGDTNAANAAASIWHQTTVRGNLHTNLALLMAHRAMAGILEVPPPLLASALYGLNPTDSFSVWSSLVAQAVVAGRERTVQFIRFLIAEYRFLDADPSLLNHRERDALSKLFEAGPFASSSCLRASTYREILLGHLNAAPKALRTPCFT